MNELPTHARHAFVSLSLPSFSPDRSFYVNSVAGMGLDVDAALRDLKIQPEHFPHPSDQQVALRTNSLWMWEEMGSGKEGEKRNIGVASSLAALLAPHARAGQEENQRLAAELYEQLFPKVSLCYCDFFETGHDTAEKFVEDDDVFAGFYCDEQDLRQAKKRNVVWTMVDMTSSKTLYSSSTLQGVLGRAWEYDPRIAMHQRLTESLVAPSRPARSHRF